MGKNRSYNKMVKELEPKDELKEVLEAASAKEDVETVEDTDTTSAPVVSATDNLGHTVIKPEVHTSPVKQEVQIPVGYPAQSASTAPTLSPRAAQLTKLIDVYLNFNKGDIMRTSADTERAGALFRETLKFALDNPEQDVLNVMYKFFKQHRNRILAPEFVFPALLSIDKQLAEKLSCIYTMFRMLTGEKAAQVNVAVLRQMLGSSRQDAVDKLLLFYTQKSNAQ